MRGLLLRLAIGFLTLIIGLGVAAIFGANLRPNFTHTRTYSYRVTMPPAAPRADYDDEYYRGRSCPHHRDAQIIQPRLDVAPQSETVKPVKQIPAQPRSRF